MGGGGGGGPGGERYGREGEGGRGEGAIGRRWHNRTAADDGLCLQPPASSSRGNEMQLISVDAKDADGRPRGAQEEHPRRRRARRSDKRWNTSIQHEDDKQTDRKTDRHEGDRHEADRATDRQRHADKQTDKQKRQTRK